MKEYLNSIVPFINENCKALFSITTFIALCPIFYNFYTDKLKKKEEGYNSIGTYELSSFAFAFDDISENLRVHFKVTSGQLRISNIKIINQNNCIPIIINENEFKDIILSPGKTYNIITFKNKSKKSLDQNFDKDPIINITYSDVHSKYYKIDSVKIFHNKYTTELISSNRTKKA